MTVRDLSRAQCRVMDLLAEDGDRTNKQLAHMTGWSPSYVEKLLTGAFAVYRVQSRTGAVAAHIRRRGRRVRALPQSETLGLA